MPTRIDPLPVRRISRFDLAADTRDTLWKRQAGWVGGVVGGGLLLMASGGFSHFPELALLPLGLGALLAHPKSAVKGLGLTAAVLGTALLLGPLTPGTSTLSQWLSTKAALATPDVQAAQSLGAAFVLGGLLPLVDEGPRQLGRSLHGALALTATAGLGAWAAAQLVQPDWVPWASSLIAGTIIGLVSAQTLLVLALRHQTIDRIPTREVIASTLDDAHRGPALVAWQLDHDLEDLSPDQGSRDGLGEVAVWVYRLQHTLQTLEAERAQEGDQAVLTRIEDLSARAADAEDAFTRDRLLATVQHLQRLQGHRTALEAERTRTAALAEFAMAFLQEARAELTLARMQPGDARPDRLPEVLDRLRTYSADRALARQTRRELSTLAG